MFPGLSPRDLKRALKRMGIRVEELNDAVSVEIILKDKKIIIDNPQVIAMRTGDQTVYQVIGTPHIEELKEEKPSIEISEEDVEFVASQTGVSQEEARKALIESGGDIAEAILILKSKR